MSFLHGPSLVTNGLVLCLDAANVRSYPGSGTDWTDLSGNGNNGTLANSPTYNSSGFFTFNGTNQRATTTRMISGDFTLSCWFRTSSTAGSGTGQWWQGRGLVDCEVAGSTNDFGLSIGNGVLLFGIGNTDTTIRSPSTYNNGIWTNVYCTRMQSSGAIILYANGLQVATGTGQTGALTAPPNISIAALQTNSEFFAGDISLVTIYSRVLSADEVLQNFNAHRARFGI